MHWHALSPPALSARLARGAKAAGRRGECGRAALGRARLDAPLGRRRAPAPVSTRSGARRCHPPVYSIGAGAAAPLLGRLIGRAPCRLRR